MQLFGTGGSLAAEGMFLLENTSVHPRSDRVLSMPMPPHDRRASRAAVAALGAAGLIALAAAPTAFADEPAAELVIGGIEPIDGVQPGSTFDLPGTVANKGTVAAVEPGAVYAPERLLLAKALDRAFNDELLLRAGENDPMPGPPGSWPSWGSRP
ncbi:hypothetical protein [Streptomyces sp. AS58]|uniref:hypothetical protein n=1 Tax=Streptomyces sp. AS58 TaxID=1519489 RepID=UPI00131B3906|nr:hypothetical protein [Streptomyces sp. AS58]